MGEEQMVSLLQLGSIVLVCLGGYAVPLDGLHTLFDALRADISFTFFSLFVASTILL